MVVRKRHSMLQDGPPAKSIRVGWLATRPVISRGAYVIQREERCAMRSSVLRL